MKMFVVVSMCAAGIVLTVRGADGGNMFSVLVGVALIGIAIHEVIEGD